MLKRIIPFRPFKGAWFYEAQIGPLVLQLRHAKGREYGFRRAQAWRDPLWRS